jgi:adenosylcobinamide kinase / adenosylcobinamide-phosphate guanylyltransferase
MSPRARIALVGGGVRSGKSAFAVRLAEKLGARKAFIATAIAYDEEMQERISRHQRERADRFQTHEEPYALPDRIRLLENQDVVVIDCLTLWVANMLLRKDTVDQILERVDELIHVLQSRRFHAVLVTNEVGMSVHPETALGRKFQDVTGWAHQRVSRAADDIYLAVLGTILHVHPSGLTAESILRGGQ